MTVPLHFYLLDADGWRVLATPLPLMANHSTSLVELDARALQVPHHAEVRRDAEHFHARGARAALIFDLGTEWAPAPQLIATLWLQGPCALQPDGADGVPNARLKGG